MPRSNGARSAELRPSAVGLALSAAAAILLSLGLAKDSLPFLFWGAAFLFLPLLALLGLLVDGWRAARSLRAGGEISASLSKDGEAGLLRTWPGEALRLRTGEPTIRPILPWMDIRVGRSWRRPAWKEARAPGWSLAFEAFEGSAHRAPGRGEWTSESAELRVGDAAGFFRLSLRSEGSDRFIVWPEILPPPAWARGGSGGEESRREESFRRSEELLDSRPYQPGDDARRINWKQLAHLEELFVRQGEPEPPPRSLCLVMVDPSAPERSEARSAQALADRLAALCAAWSQESARMGTQILLAAPSGPVAVLAAGGSKPEALLDRLAALPPLRGITTEARQSALRGLLSAAPQAARRVELFCLPDRSVVDSWALAASALNCRLSYSLCAGDAGKGLLEGGPLGLAAALFTTVEDGPAEMSAATGRSLSAEARTLVDEISSRGSHAARAL